MFSELNGIWTRATGNEVFFNNDHDKMKTKQPKKKKDRMIIQKKKNKTEKPGGFVHVG